MQYITAQETMLVDKVELARAERIVGATYKFLHELGVPPHVLACRRFGNTNEELYLTMETDCCEDCLKNLLIEIGNYKADQVSVTIKNKNTIMNESLE